MSRGLYTHPMLSSTADAIVEGDQSWITMLHLAASPSRPTVVAAPLPVISSLSCLKRYK